MHGMVLPMLLPLTRDSLCMGRVMVGHGPHELLRAPRMLPSYAVLFGASNAAVQEHQDKTLSSTPRELLSGLCVCIG